VPSSFETETSVLDPKGQDGGGHHASVEGSGMEAYVAAKLRALAPWSEGSHTYQRVFAEAYQLCQRGSDFNLIYRESEGRFVRLFTPQSQPGNPAWLRADVLRKWSKRRRETAGWRQLSGIVQRRSAGHLWVQE
jgi:hypothetical protein